MFDFLSMAGTYESRKVDNTTIGDTVVDTCLVNDGNHPYETGIKSPAYNDGFWVIVEAYDTKQDAQVGHDKWVALMSGDERPESLVDCHNSFISQLFCESWDDEEEN